MTREEIMLAARRRLGVRYANYGRSDRGLDCLGLACVIADDFGLPYEDPRDYSRFPDGRMVPMLRRFLVLAQPPIRVGQLVALRDKHSPCHVGIIGFKDGQLSLIHASLPKHKVYEEHYAPWHSMLRSVFEFPGVED